MATGKELLLALASKVNTQEQQIASLTARVKKLEAGGDDWLDEELDAAANVAEDIKANVREGYGNLDPNDPEDAQALAAIARLARDKPGQHVSEAANDSALTSELDEGSVVVELPVPDERRIEARREFAIRDLQLPDVWPAQADQVVEAYAQGGPMWLYLQEEGRDLILQLPVHLRIAMVKDVGDFSISDAQELGRDILKSTSPGSADEHMERLGHGTATT